MASTKQKPLIIAHRGANKIAPENTLKAFKKTIELEADFVEFDVQASKDGELVIMHDSNTFRTTGYKGSIEKMTLAELKQLDCGEGEKIPTLKELIALAKNHIGLQLEIKAPGTAERIVAMLKDNGLIESTIVSSFNHEELLTVQKIEPRLRLGALVPTGTGWLLDWFCRKKMIDGAIKNKFSHIHPLHKLVNQVFVDYAHQNNLKINVWTVDDEKSMNNFAKMGIDGIITNELVKAIELRKSWT